jgi:hypothetical protein
MSHTREATESLVESSDSHINIVFRRHQSRGEQEYVVSRIDGAISPSDHHALLHHVRRCVEGRGHEIALQKISLFWYFSLFREIPIQNKQVALQLTLQCASHGVL